MTWCVHTVDMCVYNGTCGYFTELGCKTLESDLDVENLFKKLVSLFQMLIF